MFRIYLRGRSGAIQGREDFSVENDDAARIVARLLLDACSDVCDRVELWEGTRRIELRDDISFLPIRPGEVTQRMQASLVECEEAIQRGRWAVASSQRLLERLDALRATTEGSRASA